MLPFHTWLEQFGPRWIQRFHAGEISMPVKKNPNVKMYALPVERIIQMAQQQDGQLENPRDPSQKLIVNPDGKSVTLRSIEKTQIATVGQVITVSGTGAWWPQPAANLENDRKESGKFQGWDIYTPLDTAWARVQKEKGVVNHPRWGALRYDPDDVILSLDKEGTEQVRPIDWAQFKATWQIQPQVEPYR